MTAAGARFAASIRANRCLSSNIRTEPTRPMILPTCPALRRTFYRSPATTEFERSKRCFALIDRLRRDAACIFVNAPYRLASPAQPLEHCSRPALSAHNDHISCVPAVQGTMDFVLVFGRSASRMALILRRSIAGRLGVILTHVAALIRVPTN
jgi:hypothetical protein